MKRGRVVFALASVAALVVMGLARASHNADLHSANMSLVASFTDGGTIQGGTDIAFWGNYAISGNQTPGGFRVIDISNPAAPVEIGQFDCNGSQSDVSVWENLVFVSVDGPRAGTECNAGTGSAWEGIRIVSIADPTSPTQIATVRTDCGSHTNTLVPDLANNRVLVYVLSYPLGDNSPTCSVLTHRKISVVEVPLATPASASVIATPTVGPAAIGCHDVTVLLEKKLAGAACISESQLWDITNPTQPMILAHIVNPAINIHHSTTFSWDGNTLVIGDEMGGAAAAPGCVFSTQGSPAGALWFYDVTNRAIPVVRSSYHIPQQDLGIVCSAHNFNTLPLTSGRDVLTSAWYSGATTIVDFTNPASPTQVGFYIPKVPIAANAWSSYWYRDRMYANNRNARGVDVLALDDASLLTEAVDLPRLNQSTMEPFNPTAAAVLTLQSIPTKRGVVVRWRTASETRLAGFNLYRLGGTGRLERLNRALIPARSSGRTGGHVYRYTDRRGRAGVTYRLELVRLDGRKVWSGTTTPRAG